MNFKVINNKLHFDVYQKPTEFSSYLRYKRFHPPDTKNNIPLSLARRVVQNCY